MRLYLLRHGEVTSQRGDVPITDDAESHSYAVGRGLGKSESGPIRVLSGETRRARDTATHLARGLVDSGAVVSGPTVAFALRNPDLYLGGHRVDMVSSAEALAAQVAGLDTEEVAALSFYPEFIVSPDRIGWWLGHDSPPGDDAGAVARRVRAFALSLLDPVGARPEVVVAVTHSPLLRAVGHDLLGRDIGEPSWVAGLILTVAEDGAMTVGEFVPESA